MSADDEATKQQISISMIVDRNPFDLTSDDNDLEEIEKKVQEDPSYRTWLLEAPINSVIIEPVDWPPEIPDLSENFMQPELNLEHHIPEDYYQLQLTSVEDKKNGPARWLDWTFVGLEGAAEGKEFQLRTSLTDEIELWKLKHVLNTLQVEIPNSGFDLDIDNLIGKKVVGCIQDTEYEVIRSLLVDVMPTEVPS
jgi:hypothetical protein